MEEIEKATCPYCSFEGDFEHRWVKGDLLVVCPSCREAAYRVDKEDIDSFVSSILSDSMAGIKDACERRKP